MAHKLKGELVTRDDPGGRPTLHGRLHQMGVPQGLIAIVSSTHTLSQVLTAKFDHILHHFRDD
jgi:hypothetical protein